MTAQPTDAPDTYGRAPEAASDGHSGRDEALRDEAPLGADEPDGGETSDLDDLEAELTAAVTPTTDVVVEPRPRYTLRVRLDFTGKDLDGIRKSARDRKFVDGVDGSKFAAIGLAKFTTAVLRDGTPLELDGEVATFRSRAFLDLLGAATAVEGVRRLFGGLEGYLNGAMTRVMTEAGWGEDAITADPI